jgi:hypothetical protein
MAEKIKFTIDIDDNGSAKVVDKLNDGLKDTKKSGEKAADGIEATAKAAKKGEGTFKTLGAAIKGAFAIGGVMKVLDILATLFMENQKVVDLMSQAMVVLQGVMNGVIEVLEPLFVALQKVFKDPVQSIKDFGNLIQENLMNRLNGILELIPKLGEAFSLLFKGEFTEAGKVATNAFGKVILGVNDTVGAVQELGKITTDAFNTISKSTKKAFNNKEILANVENNIEKLSILFSGIVEKYDNMAEKQRQIRDDEKNTIAERIAANEELAKVLAEGEEKEKANIQARIGLLQMQQKYLGNNKQRQNEILSLQQEITGVEAKYTGLKSEQMVNINGLEKEGLELKKAAALGTIEANALMAQSEADLLGETLEGFAAKKQALTDEFVARRALLDAEIANNKEGTQAYIDAVNERKLLDAQYAVDTKALVKEVQDFKTEQVQKDIDDTKKANDEKSAIEQAKFDDTMKALNQMVNVTKAFMDNFNAQTDKDYENRIKHLKELGYTEDQISKMRDSELEKIDERARRNFEIGKNINYAQTLLSTIQATQEAFTTANKSPLTALFPAYPYIQAGFAAAFGAAQLQQIGQTSYQSKSSPSAGGGGGGSVSGPSVGIIQGQMSQTSQLQAEMNAQMKRPTRAYVVGQNVTTQQSLDRHILENATL